MLSQFHPLLLKICSDLLLLTLPPGLQWLCILVLFSPFIIHWCKILVGVFYLTIFPPIPSNSQQISIEGLSRAQWFRYKVAWFQGLKKKVSKIFPLPSMRLSQASIQQQVIIHQMRSLIEVKTNTKEFYCWTILFLDGKASRY